MQACLSKYSTNFTKVNKIGKNIIQLGFVIMFDIHQVKIRLPGLTFVFLSYSSPLGPYFEAHVLYSQDIMDSLVIK